MSQMQAHSGFTLVEMLVYLAILLMVVTAGIATLLGLQEPFASYKANQLLYRTADAVLMQIATDVRNATTVDVPASTLESSPGVLVIDTADGTRRFALVGDDIEYSQAGNFIGDLNPTSVSVETITFTHYESTNTEAVQTEMTLRVSVGNSSLSETFYTTSVLRNSYE